jgi:lysyl-tRNA synthetase class II
MSDEASCQHMIVMQAVCGTQQVPYQGQTLDLAKPFRRATMHELVREALGENTCHATATELTSEVTHDMLS